MVESENNDERIEKNNANDCTTNLDCGKDDDHTVATVASLERNDDYSDDINVTYENDQGISSILLFSIGVIDLQHIC